MKKSLRKLVVAMILFVSIMGYLYFKSVQSAARDTTNTIKPVAGHVVDPVRPENPVAAYFKEFQTPIEFYGKVVNQHGEPVENASIILVPFDNPGEYHENGGSRILQKSDKEGLFSARNLKGMALAVSIEKKGFLTYPDLGFDKRASSRLIEYGLNGDSGARFKNPDNPTLFMLHEVGDIDPVVYVRKRWRLPVDGEPVQIALDSEDGKGAHQIEFRFKSGWSQLPSGKRYGRKFDWKVSARIPGGGFFPNDSEYNFEAPEEGYKETIELEFSALMPQEEWKATAFRRCFVKFADGSYGRIRFRIDGGSDRRPLDMASWLNLKPGSRNLASEQWDPTVVGE